MVRGKPPWQASVAVLALQRGGAAHHCYMWFVMWLCTSGGAAPVVEYGAQMWMRTRRHEQRDYTVVTA
jgi:hypothetical protein